MKYSLVPKTILIMAGCLMAVMVIHSGCNPACEPLQNLQVLPNAAVPGSEVVIKQPHWNLL